MITFTIFIFFSFIPKSYNLFDFLKKLESEHIKYNKLKLNGVDISPLLKIYRMTFERCFLEYIKS